MYRIILPKDKEVVVTSFGGVGTSFILKFLSDYKNSNDPTDKDGFKHLPIPPISFNPDARFVYIFGNPTLSVISLFKRNYHYEQSIKLQRYFGKRISPIPKNMTLNNYASIGADKFFFRDHFYNWYKDSYLVHPTIFIRYESIYENITTLCNFLSLPTTAISNFPKKKSRSSSERDLSEKTFMQLNKIYEKFTCELNNMQDVEIRLKSKSAFSAVNYLKKPYLKALALQYNKEIRVYLKNILFSLYRPTNKMK